MEQDIYDRTVSYIIENQEKFYRLAYSYVRNKDAALDVVQSAICKGLEKCCGLKNPAALKTWFYRIVVNESIQYIRDNRREVVSADGELPEQSYHEPAYDRNREVYEEVARLPEPMRTVVVLHFYEELTLKQISEVTGTNLSTVKSRLYSALNKMGKKLKEAAV
ncbi:MAG: RNA polymerase sigma factor [Eubacteriales bacterium]|nr:RNA polymerase sigma factor [Eubacteriales bacterium]